MPPERSEVAYGNPMRPNPSRVVLICSIVWGDTMVVDESSQALEVGRGLAVSDPLPGTPLSGLLGPMEQSGESMSARDRSDGTL